MTMLGHNKLCEIEDFSHPDLLAMLGEIRPDSAAIADRRDWEMAMAARALRSRGGLHHDAVLLAVGVGPGDLLVHLSRHARQVFATERFHGAGSWRSLAPVALMVEPSLVSPELDPTRLIVQHMDERDLRFPDDFFDSILWPGVISRFEELQDVANAAYEMGRVLKPEGVLTLSTDLRLNGPPGGVGWPGRSLLLSPAHLQRYIVDASGLEPVDTLLTEPSPATLETRRDLGRAIVDVEGRVVESAATGHGTADLPRLVELEGGYVYTSVQLTLRKTAAYPAARNTWARASSDTLDALANHNRALLRGRGPGAAADLEVEDPAPAPVLPDPLEGSWAEIEGTHRQRGELLAAYEHRVSTACADMLGRRHAIDENLVELDRARRQGSARLSRLLDEIVEQDHRLAAFAGTGLPPSANDSVASRVAVSDQVSFDAVVGDEMDDPVATMLRQGSVCDPALVALMLQLLAPGERMIDLGAHLGTFALAAAAAGCHVLAVEASPRNAELLHASAARNGFTDLRVIHAVASDEPGTASFCPNGPWGHVAAPAAELPAVTVPAVTMDELLAEMGWFPVSLVKLDVEGSEVRVIRSLQTLLEGPDAPPLLFESNGHTLDLFGLTPQDLLGALEALGYTSHAVEPGRLVALRAVDVQPQTILDCLAFKHRPAGLVEMGWQVDPPMSAAELVGRIRADCRHANVAHRRYMASALARAEPSTLEDPGVVEILEELTCDPDDAVRAAMSWWTGGDGGRP
ncbi:MAG TPA: FkbM family methyltransferase [Acidimicrobiales bacterium]|jgi:FkbM family methyltransferase|nr:FkbM family methyltransferase [Acidimicrobiales bacterium]